MKGLIKGIVDIGAKTALVMAVALTSVAAYGEQDQVGQIDVPIDMQQISGHQVVIKGQRISYSAEVGMQPVFNDEGKATASLFYTYYKRTDITDTASRPLLISFNGGPGSASVWMHVAYTGPRVLNVDSEGYPLQPYGVKDNPHSVLDVADIVFVNPVNTGFSRVLPDEEGNMPSRDQQKSMFFGVNEDIAYLADWINTFINRKARWHSPKFLIGESYGTTRVSGLALELQEQQWMYLNGVVLVSPTDIGLERAGAVKQANRLPYFAAAAWYHKQLPESLQQKDLLQVLDEVEAYALDTYLPALARGNSLPKAQFDAVADKVAMYSGLSVNEVVQNNLDISTAYFWKALLRDEGKTIGRLDSRYLGIDEKEVGDYPDYWAELTSWLHSFTPAINTYLRDELGFKTDLKYNMFGSVHPWNREGNRTGQNLRKAMAQNPYLKVMVQSGYYDGATNYFDGKYNLWQLDRSGKMKDRMSFKGYRSGHMMYLRADDLAQSNDDLRQFMLDALVANDKPAKY